MTEGTSSPFSPTFLPLLFLSHPLSHVPPPCVKGSGVEVFGETKAYGPRPGTGCPWGPYCHQADQRCGRGKSSLPSRGQAFTT